jgi:flagellar basal-body rod protein FlgB
MDVMWLDRLIASPMSNAAELSARFAEARQQVLAENLANIDTPGYQTRRLDQTVFQRALRDAVDQAEQGNTSSLNLRDTPQLRIGPDGRPEFRPVLEPAQNVLFHDGTNARLERLMSDVNENAISYELATSALRSRFDGLMRAIRGRVT